MNRAERRRTAKAAGRILRRDHQGKAEWRDLSPREAKSVEVARAADAAWFERRPLRSHRLRPAIPHELPGLSAEMAEDAWIVVRQLIPGFRVKSIFTPPGPLPDAEDLGHALFDLIQEHGVLREREITHDEIRLRVAMLASVGRA